MNRECNNGNMRREEMAMEIKAYQFAVTDITLYLDTHPDDEKALCLHREYARRLKELRDKYQKIYGPLTIEYPCNKWRWLEEPCPSFIWGVNNYLSFLKKLKSVVAVRKYKLIKIEKRVGILKG